MWGPRSTYSLAFWRRSPAASLLAVSMAILAAANARGHATRARPPVQLAHKKIAAIGSDRGRLLSPKRASAHPRPHGCLHTPSTMTLTAWIALRAGCDIAQVAARHHRRELIWARGVGSRVGDAAPLKMPRATLRHGAHAAVRYCICSTCCKRSSPRGRPSSSRGSRWQLERLELPSVRGEGDGGNTSSVSRISNDLSRHRLRRRRVVREGATGERVGPPGRRAPARAARECRRARHRHAHARLLDRARARRRVVPPRARPAPLGSALEVRRVRPPAPSGDLRRRSLCGVSRAPRRAGT